METSEQVKGKIAGNGNFGRKKTEKPADSKPGGL